MEGIQPYAPLRVLRQFGMIQNVPLWSNMALSEVNYEGKIPMERLGNLISGWGQIISLGQRGDPYFTPEYYTWPDQVIRHFRDLQTFIEPIRSGISCCTLGP